MKNFTRVMLYATAPFMLLACSDQEIESVKNAYTDRSATTTYANLLETKSYCEKVTWDKFLDQQNRTTVEYQCQIFSSKDALSLTRTKQIDLNTRHRNSQIESLQEKISKVKQNLKEGYPEYERKINRYLARIERLKKERSEPIIYDETLQHIEELERLIAMYRNNRTEENMISLMNSSAFKTFIDQQRKYVRDYSIFDGIGGFDSQYSYMMQQKTEEERKEYKQENVQKYIDYNTSFFPELEEGFRQATNQFKVDYTASFDRDIASTEELILETQDNLESAKQYDREVLARAQENIKIINENNSDQKFEERTLSTFPVTGYAFERFQWVVNQHGKVTLTYGDIYALKESSSEEYIFREYPNPSLYITRVQSPDL